MVDDVLHEDFNDIDSRSDGQLRWTFSLGKHVVKYLLYDNTTIPACMFKGHDDAFCYYYEDYLQYVKNREGGFGVYNFPYLTKIHIPDNFTIIENEAFTGCHDLKEIEWSKNMQVVTGDAFSQCSGLEKLEIPETVQNITIDWDNYKSGLNLFGLLNLKEFTCNADNFMQDEIFMAIEMTSLPYIELPNVSEVYFLEASNEKMKAIIVGENTTDLVIARDVNIIVEHLPYWDRIISKSLTAPDFKLYSFDEWMPAVGTLYVPTGATGYETWMEVLPDGWSMQYVDDIEDFTTQIKEEIRQEEALRQEHAADYADGLKLEVMEPGEYQIFNDAFDLNLIEKMFVTDMSTNTKTVIDIKSNVSFGSGTCLTVTLKDPTTIPDGMFKGVTPYLGILLPECLQSIGNEAFAGSNVCQLAFRADTPPTVSENSLVGLIDENTECGIVFPENEENDYTYWEEFLLKFPEIWQSYSGPTDISEFKVLFVY